MRPALGGLPEADAQAEVIALPATTSPSALAGQAGSPGLAVRVDVARRDAPTAPGPGLDARLAPPPAGLACGQFCPPASPGTPCRQPGRPDRHPQRFARGSASPPRDAFALALLRRREDRLAGDVQPSPGRDETRGDRGLRGQPADLGRRPPGLAWIEKGQHRDGYWSLERIYTRDRGQDYPGQGNQHSDSAATGLGLLPFLGDGNTHLTGEHQATVRKAIAWLVKHQKPNGDLSFQADGNSQMYSHAIAAIALCEAFGMSKDPDLRRRPSGRSTSSSRPRPRRWEVGATIPTRIPTPRSWVGKSWP